MTTGDWHDIDLYGDNRVSGSTYYTGNSLKTNVTSSPTNGGEIISPDSDLDKAYKETYGSTAAAPTGSIAYQITGLDMDKVEIVIYMAGSDPDCNDQGKTAAGSIKMFFNTANATSAAPTGATVDSNGILSLTGVANSTIEYQIDGGQWTAIAGSWVGTTFTATAALPESAKGATIQVRQTQSGKDASSAAPVTNQFQSA